MWYDTNLLCSETPNNTYEYITLKVEEAWMPTPYVRAAEGDFIQGVKWKHRKESNFTVD